MKTIIVYYSFSGNNQKLAYKLQEKLNCSIHKIYELNPRTKLTIFLDLLFLRKPQLTNYNKILKKYDQVIFVGPIWYGKIATPIKSFIEKEKEYINKYYFITICNGETNQKEKLTKELTKLANKEPVLVKELPLNKMTNKNKFKYRSSIITIEELKEFEEEIDEFVK